MMMVKKSYNGLVTHDLHLSSGFYLDLFRGTYEIKKEVRHLQNLTKHLKNDIEKLKDGS
jgi:archaellum component FlaC